MLGYNDLGSGGLEQAEWEHLPLREAFMEVEDEGKTRQRGVARSCSKAGAVPQGPRG